MDLVAGVWAEEFGVEKDDAAQGYRYTLYHIYIYIYISYELSSRKLTTQNDLYQ